MAVLRAACPSCGATVKVTDESLAGSAVECPKCGEEFVIPEFESEDAERPAKKRSKKGGKKTAAASSKAPLLIGGAAALVVVGVAVFFLTRPKEDEAADGNRKAPPPPPPGVMEGRGGPGDGGPPVNRGEQPAVPPPDTPKLQPGERAVTFDKSKLTFDPSRPDQFIPAAEWPRRSGRGDTSLEGYAGKVIATEGRIRAFHGGDRGPKPGDPLGPVEYYFYLFDAGGKLFGSDGRAVPALVSISSATHDWKQFRPGQVVKVAGRVKPFTPTTTNVGLSDGVVLSVAGDGDPPLTTDELLTALQRDPKPFTAGLTTDRYVTLNAVVGGVTGGQYPSLLLAHPKTKVVYRIRNLADFNTRPPKAGDAVTLIGRVSNPAAGDTTVNLEGMFLPK